MERLSICLSFCIAARVNHEQNYGCNTDYCIKKYQHCLLSFSAAPATVSALPTH